MGVPAHKGVGDVECANGGSGHVVPEGEAEVGDPCVDGYHLGGENSFLARALRSAGLNVDVLTWSKYNVFTMYSPSHVLTWSKYNAFTTYSPSHVLTWSKYNVFT